jgi:glycosyltransferase involved in cell wall biosynthesis
LEAEPPAKLQLGATLRILHVVATGKRRGAEVFASDLVQALDAEGISQHVGVLRSDELEIDFVVPRAFLGDGGRKLPVANVSPGALRNLHALNRAFEPDVVQAHGGEALKYATASLVGSKTPLIYRRIGGAPSWVRRGIRRRAHGSLMRRAKRIVAVAEDLRREAVELFGVDPHKITTIPNGVDRRRLTATRTRDETRASLGIAPEAPMLVSLGAISWEKDPLGHLRVTARVLREIGDVVHVWVGDGPMREELRAAASEQGLDGRVLVLGSRRDVADLLIAGDVLLFASRTDGMEGMPAAVIEAGMVGTPVAGYAVAGVPEVVIDGETGSLVAPGDLDGLAERVVDLLGDEKRRRAIGESARERCLARFEIHAVAPKYVSLYEQVVGS